MSKAEAEGHAWQPIGIPTYAQLPLCIDPGTHYFQLDHIKRDTAVCTRCGLIRKQVT